MTETILIGVLSSVIATTIWIFFTKYFEKVTLPWLRSFVYKGIDVRGRWACFREFPDQTNEDAYLNITQQADKISGTFLITGNPENKKEFIIYNITGYIKDQFIIATTNSSHNNSVLHYTFLLKIKDEINGLCLDGRLLFYDDKNNCVSSGKLYFQRTTA